MKLYLYGHDYKYAAEQMMLSLYPSERPEYPEGKPEGDRVELRLSNGNIYTTASCRLVLNSVEYNAKSSVKTGLMTDDISRDKLCSRIIKTAFYRAALRSGHKRPAWGMLTGVRPGKLFREELEGKTPDAALKKFISDYDVTEPRAILCRDTALVTESVISSLGERDVCLYVGIPFCPTRCSYCSFVSQSVEKSMKLIPPFMDALMQEIDAAAAAVNKLAEQDPAYAEVAQQLSEKNAKIQSRRGVKKHKDKAEKTEEAPVKTEKSAEEKPKRTYRKPSGDRPFRKEGDRPYRKNDGEKRSFHKDGEYRPYRKNDGEKRPFRKDGDRPYRKNDGEKRPFRKDGEYRPYRKNDGEKRPFRKDGEYRPYRKNDGEKRPFRKDGERRPYRKSGAGKPSFNSGKRSFRNKT